MEAVGCWIIEKDLYRMLSRIIRITHAKHRSIVHPEGREWVIKEQYKGDDSGAAAIKQSLI